MGASHHIVSREIYDKTGTSIDTFSRRFISGLQMTLGFPVCEQTSRDAFKYL